MSFACVREHADMAPAIKQRPNSLKAALRRILSVNIRTKPHLHYDAKSLHTWEEEAIGRRLKLICHQSKRNAPLGILISALGRCSQKKLHCAIREIEFWNS